MASKLMSRISDLKRKLSSRASTSSPTDFLRINIENVRDNFDSDSAVVTDEFLTNAYLERCSSADHSNSLSILNTEISLLDAAAAAASIIDGETEPPQRRTADDVWKEIVEGKKKEQQHKKQQPKEEMMTLEDFLVKAGAVEETVAVEVKEEVLSGGINTYENISSAYSGSVIGTGMGLDTDGLGSLGKGRGKRSLSLLEPLDKAAQQRQRRMIKNRESAARSRERKQAYQVELEAMAVRLEEENERLLKEKEERMKQRLKQLLQNVIPVVEKRRPPRVLRKVNSMQW